MYYLLMYVQGLKVDFLYSVDILFDVKETIFIMIWSLFSLSLSLTGQTKEQSQLIQRGFLGLTWKDAAIAILLITIIISCSTMALWAIKGRKRSSKKTKLTLIRFGFVVVGRCMTFIIIWLAWGKKLGGLKKVLGSYAPLAIGGRGTRYNIIAALD